MSSERRCPFCGGEAAPEVGRWGELAVAYGRCARCGARGPRVELPVGEDEAARAAMALFCGAEVVQDAD